MKRKSIFFASQILICLVFLLSSKQVYSQVPSPESIFGFQPGADYKLADYDQMLDYYQKLSASSNRVLMDTIGYTTLGRPMVKLIISSEENMKKLSTYREMAEELAKARISEEKAKTYVKNGKAVVWIDGGLHSNELAGAQMTPELAYEMVTSESEEIQKIRDEIILLLMPVMNPDGLDMWADWYRKNLGTPYETSRLPWLYHHYIGHDNNRDWFMNNMPESYHVNDVLYREWFPQIVYNHHQTSPRWARIFIPPFSNPVNPRIHPGITTGTNLVGTAMANRFAMEDMPGVISHINYSMWWNGGMRTVPYYHNMIGILSETGHSTPTPRFYPKEEKPETVGGWRGGMSSNGTQIFYSDPWMGGESHFRDAVEYMLMGSYAVLDLAADRKEEYLSNIYKMGKESVSGKHLGDHFTYHIPWNQANRTEVSALVNLLIHGGVDIHRANSDGNIKGKAFEKGDFLISTSQAFRPYLTDLLETQQYPDQFLYPGGPPNPPYDLAGWTLPYQMGVKIDRIEGLEAISNADLVDELFKPEADIIKGLGSHYLLPVNDNGSFRKVNSLLKAGVKVLRYSKDSDGAVKGDFLIAADDMADSKDEAYFRAKKIRKPNLADTYEVQRHKIGLYKSWDAEIDEGWTRWILEDYGFDWDTLHDADIMSKDLSEYDAIILPSQSKESIFKGHDYGEMPEEYTGGIGLEGTSRLKSYVQAGGRIISFDAAGDYLIDYFDLPLRNVTNGQSSNSFFIPGSLLRAKVNTDHWSTWGLTDTLAVSFSRSSAYQVIEVSYSGEGGEERSVKRLPKPEVNIPVSYAENDLLISGWAMGEKRVLSEKAAMVVMPHGKGDLVLFGFRPQFRGQARATYPLIFNLLYDQP